MAEFPREVIECMADHYILLCLTEIDRLTALLASEQKERRAAAKKPVICSYCGYEIPWQEDAEALREAMAAHVVTCDNRLEASMAADIIILQEDNDRLTALLADRDAEIARLKRYVGVMDATMKIEDKPSVEVKR